MRSRMLTLGMLAAAMTWVAAGCDELAPSDASVLAPGSLAGLETEALAEDLRFLREEEKLAHDVYVRLGEQWATSTFANIAASEQTHTERVRDLLAALVIADPVVSDAVGALVEPALAALFTDLVASGGASEEAAIRVGATIEDLDIADLRSMAARTELPEALVVYRALECGSRNHLRSFGGRLADLGVPYVAAYLSQADVDAIVASPREKCGG